MTAPLLSPIDISPRFEPESWLDYHPESASNTLAYSEFAAAFEATPFSFPQSFTNAPSDGSFSSAFDFTAFGPFSYGIAQTTTEPPNFYGDYTEDIQQACYNSLVNTNVDQLTEPLNQSFEENPGHDLTECMPINTNLSYDVSSSSRNTATSVSLTTTPVQLEFSLEISSADGASFSNSYKDVASAPTNSFMPDYSSTQQWESNWQEIQGANSAYGWSLYSSDTMKTEQIIDTFQSPTTDMVSPLLDSKSCSSYGCSTAALCQPRSPGCPLSSKRSTPGASVTKNKHAHQTFITMIPTATGCEYMVEGPSRNKRPRRTFDPVERKETALTRKIRACDNCRKSRRKCARGQSRYVELLLVNMKTLKLPCYLSKFEEARLFRGGPTVGHPMRCSDEVYKSLELSRRQYDCHRLRLTQDYGGHELVVDVAEFVPQPGDKTAHIWKDTNGWHEMEIPPYCIVGIEEAKKNMLEYIHKSKGAILRELLDGSNDITCEVFGQAIRYASLNKNSLVQQALDLFAAARIIERDWRVSDPSTLNLPEVFDPKSPWAGIPVTPVMDGQLDQIVIKAYLVPLRDSLLNTLQETIYRGRKEDWFAVFLTTFVFLTHVECLLQHSRRNARRYGLLRRYNHIPLAEEYFKASRIALAHFHFVSNGAAPLRLDWNNRDVVEMAQLDSDQAMFMSSVQAKMAQKREIVGKLRERNRYEEPLYFCHQLFDDSWEPGKIEIQDEVV